MSMKISDLFRRVLRLATHLLSVVGRSPYSAKQPAPHENLRARALLHLP